MTIRLTKTAKRAGCAAKQPPGYLLPLLERLPPITDPRVLVGSSTADDAAVYRLDDERALVTTTDFFTPIVDDPYQFGAVAAANALSDVYAMGGRPLTALNLVGFPAELDVEILAEILLGGAHKAAEAGIDLVGGHTIKSEEPIYGLAVTGIVQPDRIASNTGGRPGDRLVLTKPLGTGIITTAAKNDEDSRGAITEAIAVMSALNRSAAEAMDVVGIGEAGVHAATDVTGFGLLGHLRNIVRASSCGAVLERATIPVVEAAVAYVNAGIAPGGTHANHRFLADSVDWGRDVDKADQLLLCDAQTSGGLLIAVAPDRTDALVVALQERNTLAAAVVGELVADHPGRIAVRS
ncbi:MAG: selenide, water dikinase SelD [Deltaproteobacteria bacterium]|nr:selenide, water dikinase SelD [Deltaproteobacteria bacterium]